jgi:hypothetical protein
MAEEHIRKTEHQRGTFRAMAEPLRRMNLPESGRFTLQGRQSTCRKSPQ